MENDPPSLVNAYTPLARTVAPHGFQPVAGWCPEILECPSIVNHSQFPACAVLDLVR